MANQNAANQRNPYVKFVEIANQATESINEFLLQNPPQGETQTKAEKDRLTAAYEALPLGNVRAAYEAASRPSTTNQERADRRQVQPAKERFRQATVKAAKLLERPIVGGGHKRRATRRRSTRRRTHRRKTHRRM